MSRALPFIFGVVLGLCLSLMCHYPQISQNSRSFISRFDKLNTKSEKLLKKSSLYNETLAEKLFNEVKILCWILTTPENHQTKAIHVRNTWGQRCNKLLFFSTKADPEIGAIALPVKEGRRTLWDKTKHAFQYIHKYHFDEADWFVKADDDNYIIPENVRYLLYQYRPQTALYLGHRFAVTALPEGYMAGGGYILSKKALEKFATKISKNDTICSANEDGSEDWEMGRCLAHSAIAVDERDENLGKRFFPAGIWEHFKDDKDPGYWYDQSQYYEVSDGSLDCCSDTAVAFHYVSPTEMYLLDYLMRYVHPFGADKNSTEDLPPKLTLNEIINKSDTASASVNYVKHPTYHNLESSEKFKRKRRK